MSLFITSCCIGCGICEPECPNKAINYKQDSYVISINLCTDCVGYYKQPNCIEVCPIDCIKKIATTPKKPVAAKGK